MKKAKPQKVSNNVRLTLVLPVSVFEALERAADSEGLLWRQLAQNTVKEKFAPKTEAA